MSIRDEILSKVLEVAAPKLGQIGHDALSALGTEKTTKGDPLTGMVLQIAAKWVRDEGPEAADDLMQKLIEALDKDVHALANIPGMDALALAQLADVYQSAEAKDIKQAKKWARKSGLILRQIGQTVAQALIGAL